MVKLQGDSEANWGSRFWSLAKPMISARTWWISRCFNCTSNKDRVRSEWRMKAYSWLFHVIPQHRSQVLAALAGNWLELRSFPGLCEAVGKSAGCLLAWSGHGFQMFQGGAPPVECFCCFIPRNKKHLHNTLLQYSPFLVKLHVNVHQTNHHKSAIHVYI